MLTMTNKLRMFVVLAAVCVLVATTSAFAGTTTVTTQTYAAEAIAAGTTVVTLANIDYTMGVSRAIGQAYHIQFIISGGTWNTATVPPGTGAATSPPFVAGQFSAFAGTGNNLVTTQLFSAGATVLEYAVGIVSPTDTNLVLRLPTPPVKFNSNVPGSSITITVNLFDSFGVIDGDSTPKTIGQLATAAFYTTLAVDTGTQVDGVTAPQGTMFVVGGDDVAGRAESAITMTNVTAGVLAPSGLANYTLLAGDLVTITVMGNFQGLAANGFFLDLDNDDTSDAGPPTERFTVSGSTATLVVPGNVFTAAHSISFINDGTPLVAPRSFSISIALTTTNTVGGYTYTMNTGASPWWTWGTTGTTLVAPYVTFDPNIPVKFRFTNYTANALMVTPTVQIDSGNTGGGLTLALTSFTIPASSSITVELLNTPTAGTAGLGPLVTGVTGTMPIRGRATFRVLVGTDNVEGQMLLAGAAGIVITPLTQFGPPASFSH